MTKGDRIGDINDIQSKCNDTWHALQLGFRELITWDEDRVIAIGQWGVRLREQGVENEMFSHLSLGTIPLIASNGKALTLYYGIDYHTLAQYEDNKIDALFAYSHVIHGLGINRNEVLTWNAEMIASVGDPTTQPLADSKRDDNNYVHTSLTRTSSTFESLDAKEFIPPMVIMAGESPSAAGKWGA